MNDILKQLRVRTGLTQEKLSEELNVAPTTVQNWEKGDKIPPDALNNLVSFYRFGSNVINNLVIAFYGDGSFKNLDEILCEDLLTGAREKAITRSLTLLLEKNLKMPCQAV